MAVTFIESPVTAWVQTVSDENTAKITSIIEQLVQCCPAAPKVKGIPQIGKVRCHRNYLHTTSFSMIQTLVKEAKSLLRISKLISNLCKILLCECSYVEQVYAAMFSEDGEWYRCVIKQVFGSETVSKLL